MLNIIKYFLVSTLVFVCGVVIAETPIEDNEYVIFYHSGVLGSPIAVSNEHGKVLWYENTDPYGDGLGRTSGDQVTSVGNPIVESADNRVGYTGHEKDNTSGLTYMKARHYDPMLARFYSNDPVNPLVGGLKSFNRYSYAFNSSYRYIDPTGEHGADWTAETFDQYNNTKNARDIENGVRDGTGTLTGDYSDNDSDRMNVVYQNDAAASNEDVQFLLEVATPLGILAKSIKGYFAAKTLVPVDPNKVAHVFGQAKHNLDGLVDAFGSPENAFRALHNATQATVNNRGIKGVFETTVRIGGETVTVRGNVVEGVVKIGTAFK